MNIRWIFSLLLFAVVVCLSGIHGFIFPALISLALILVLCVTAYPISKRLFEDRVDAFTLSFPAGYILHAFLLSFVALFFGIHWISITTYLAVVVLAMIFLNRRDARAKSEWENRDWLLLYVWLFATIAIVAGPFLRVGELTSAGFAYRAYFNADFFRNMAVEGSLAASGIPPDNPYLAGNPLHYYWLWHLLPAFWSKILPGYRADFLLVQFSIASALMFVAALFVTVRKLVRNRQTLLFVLPLFTIGGSYEGLYVLQWLKKRNQPWTGFTTLNVDGILRWTWKAPQIDTLYRALLYAPQHLLALSVLLMAVLVWNREIRASEHKTEITRIVFFYSLVFATLGFSAFVGATLILGAALVMLVQTILHPREKWQETTASGILGLIFLAIYFFPLQMFQTGSQQYDVGPDKIIFAHFIPYFVLNWGALLIFGVIGIFYRSSLLPNRILLSFLAFCFALICFVRIMLAGFSDISLKVGHFSHVILLLLAAGTIDRMLSVPKKAKWLALAMFIFVLPAVVTWGMDFWNTIDIRNPRFTTYLKQGEASVSEYMRQNLPVKTVVFNYSPRYDDFMRDILPPFSQRSVYIGNRIFSRIFQVPEERVQSRVKIVNGILHAPDSDTAWKLIKQEQIQYVFVTDIGSAEWNTVLQKFATPHFSLLIQDGPTALFRVN